MSLLSASTVRRLHGLPRDQGIWEGDRRSLPPIFSSRYGGELSDEVEWVLWVDDAKVIRAMDIVPASSGPEALVRTLIKAIEYPQGPATPLCPQKLFVRDREHQFFLRGALQDLEVEVNYADELPLIDEISQSMEMISSSYSNALPESYLRALDAMAEKLWEAAPWSFFADDEILEIRVSGSLDDGGSLDETYYLCCLGLMEVEFGVLLYRSLDSLRQFRSSATDETLPEEQLESVFLSQDCLFLNYDVNAPAHRIRQQTLTYQSFSFGTIHPLEGLRPFLEEEEAIAMIASLDGLLRFLKRNHERLDDGDFPSLKGAYTVTPLKPTSTTKLRVSVKTLPEISEELLDLDSSDEDTEYWEPFSSPSGLFAGVQDDWVPENALVSIGLLPWDFLEGLESKIQNLALQPSGEGLPIITIQTSLPKGNQMIASLADAGGAVGLGFSPAWDNEQTPMEMLILMTGDQHLQILGEFYTDDPTHKMARQKWERRVQATDGWCAVLIARGITGASKGQPSTRDILAVVGVRALSVEVMGAPEMKFVPDRT